MPANAGIFINNHFTQYLYVIYQRRLMNNLKANL